MKCTYLLTQRAGSDRINFYFSTQYLPNTLQTTIYSENVYETTNKTACLPCKSPVVGSSPDLGKKSTK